MYKNIYGDNRVIIVCGKYEGMDRLCADAVYGEIAPELPYVLTICEADKLTEEQLSYYTIIAVGTKEGNSFIAKLSDEGKITVPNNKEGYRIKVFDSPYNSERQIYVIAGGGSVGAYYGVNHFVHKYITECEGCDCDYLPESAGLHFQKLKFSQKLTEVDYEESPQIAERGVWTWGHVIYDYKGFLDNMAKLRMNIVTVWNDFVPINAKEFIEYAHNLGIKVIWGFSIGWGYEFDISNPKVLEEIIDKAADNYEENYLCLGGDGIYFQTFTETKEDSKDGTNIAQTATWFVNTVSEKFRARFGDIRIQFGLHATSVKNYLDEMAKVNPDIEITWEDCGAFPWGYTPLCLDEYEQTMVFTDKITNLRGENEKFSGVLKGLSNLEWRSFEHQFGTFDMGVWAPRHVKNQYDSKSRFWRIRNLLWMKNGEKAREVVEIIRRNTKGETMLQHLLEAGVLEERINLACAIAGEILWNSNRDFSDILYEASLMADVDF